MAACAADFTDEYLRSWIEPDPERRRDLIMNMWAPDGEDDRSPAGDGCGGR